MAQPGEEYAEEVQFVAQRRARSSSLRPLRALLPFLKPYGGRMAIAFLALLASSATTLVLPAVLRGLIDRGFSTAQIETISHYFLLFLMAAALLGVATAIRYYFVTWLGERVIADIRKAVFDHVLGLSPAFFEITRTGEVLSRLTADTTLIQTVVGSSASVALRNIVMFWGGLALMFVTDVKLTTLVILAVVLVVLPLIGFGRWVRTLSRKSQDKIAGTSAHAAETLNAVNTVQAFTREDYERDRFAAATEDSFKIAVKRTFARSAMTAVAIFAVFGCIAGVGWVGAQGVVHHVSGAHGLLAHSISVGQLVQFIFYAILVAGGGGRSAKPGATCSARPAPPSDWPNSSSSRLRFRSRQNRGTCRSPAAVPCVSRTSNSAIPCGRKPPPSTAFRWPWSRARPWPWWGRRGRENPPCSSCCCASTRHRRARSPSTASTSPSWTRASCAVISRWWRRTRRFSRAPLPTTSATAAPTPAMPR
jgi:hypothetical protein